MKKVFGMILFIGLLFSSFAAVTGAADIPQKNGTVADQAGMFTKTKKKLIEGTAKSDIYTYYILTVKSLEGAKAADYASEVYASWQLTTNDILLLISKDDKHAEMNFRNPELLQLLEALPADYDKDGNEGESKIDEFLTAHFIPLAQKGDFAQGTIALMNATFRLKPADKAEAGKTPAEPASPADNPAGTSESKPVEPKEGATDGASPGNVSSPEKTEQGNTSSGIGFYILLAAAIVGIGGYLTYKKIQIEHLRKRIPLLMVDINHANEQLQPFLGLSQGTTAAMANGIDERLSALLVRLNQVESDQANVSLITLNFKKLNGIHRELRKELVQITSLLADDRQGIAKIIEADKKVKRSNEDLVFKLGALQTDLQRQSRETSFPLNKLFDDIASIDGDVKKSQELELFDPIEAEKYANEAMEKWVKAAHGVDDIPVFLDKYNDFPNTVAHCRERIAEIVKQHQLQTVMLRVRPQAHLEQARALIEDMLADLKTGAMDAVRKRSEEIDNMLATAVEMTQRQAQLKENNAKDIGLIEKKLTQYAEEGPQLANEAVRIRLTYAETHWKAMIKRYEQSDKSIQETTERLPEIKQLSQDDHQQFELAREALDEAMKRLAEADAIQEQCKETFEQLDDRLFEAQQQDEKLGEAFQRILRSIDKESLPNSAEQERLESHVRSLRAEAEKLLAASPYHLDHIEKTISQLELEVKRFTEHVDQVVRQKREAEEQYREAKSRFQSVYSRSSSKINKRSYNKSFDSVMVQAESMIARGMYAEAVRQLIEVDGIVGEMEREYRMAVEMERRQQELEREAERHLQREREQAREKERERSSQSSSSSSTSSSSSSSSSSSNSSGGASWDSDSNKNNNSSGGASW